MEGSEYQPLYAAGRGAAVGYHYKYGKGDGNIGFGDYLGGIGISLIKSLTPAGTMERTAVAMEDYTYNEADHMLNRGERYDRAIQNDDNPGEVTAEYHRKKTIAKLKLMDVTFEWISLSASGAMGSLTGMALNSGVSRNVLRSATQNYASEHMKTLSNTQKAKFNTAAGAYDKLTGRIYFGRNKGIERSGMTIHKDLKKYLPDESINAYKLGNCAECDAVNNALHNGAKWTDLKVETIGIRKDGTFFPKDLCENCTFTFSGSTGDVH